MNPYDKSFNHVFLGPSTTSSPQFERRFASSWISARFTRTSQEKISYCLPIRCLFVLHPKLQFGEVPWHCGDPYRYRVPRDPDAWTKCHNLTERYDDDMCDAWKEEVDKLLIFVR